MPSSGYLYLKVTFTCATPQNIASGFTIMRSGKVIDTGPYKSCGPTTKCVWTSRKFSDPSGSQRWDVHAEWTTAAGIVGEGTPEIHRKTSFTIYH